MNHKLCLLSIIIDEQKMKRPLEREEKFLRKGRSRMPFSALITKEANRLNNNKGLLFVRIGGFKAKKVYVKRIDMQ
jgi:hypothetical protein